MKCPNCDINMKKTKTDYIFEGIKLLENIEVEKCPKCKETVMDFETASKITERSKELGLFGKDVFAERKIMKVGNSAIISIPKEFIDILDIEIGQKAILKIVGKDKIEVQLK